MKNDLHSRYIEAGHDEYVPWGIVDVFFSYVFIFALSIIFAGVMFYVGLDFNMNFFSVVLQVLLSVSTFVIVYVIVTQKYKVPFNEAFGFSADRIPGSVSQGIFVTALIIISTTIISILFSKLSGAEPINPYRSMSEERFKWLTILALFFAPVVEEIFFRGFMQPAISKIVGSFLGIFITAVIFGISHTQYLDYSTAIFSVTVIGLILGITKYKTGSVMPGIFAHFFNNLLAVVYLAS